MGTIIFHFWNEASLINCKAITIVKRLEKILPESPEETAGSYCKCLGGHAGTTTCVCALCIIVLFCNNLGESVRAPLRWTGGCQRKHLYATCFYWQSAGGLGGSTYVTIVIPPREGNHGLYWHLGEKTWVTSENACFSPETLPQIHFTLH